MRDAEATVMALRSQVAAFNQKRGWQRYNTPKNLALALIVENGELQELFLSELGPRCGNSGNKQLLANELADVTFVLFQFCNVCGIDISTTMAMRMREGMC